MAEARVLAGLADATARRVYRSRGTTSTTTFSGRAVRGVWSSDAGRPVRKLSSVFVELFSTGGPL